MPFTEPEDVSVRLRPQRGVAQRWLREIFVEDWGVKLLALGITLVLWYAVTGQRTPKTIRLRNVRLDFERSLPNNLEIIDPHAEVEVILTGNKNVLERIDAHNLVVYVDSSDFKPGERTVQLTPDKVTLGLPDGVRLEGVEPNTMPLRIEPRIERELDVEVRREGNIPEGYEVREVKVDPARVRVRGPASRVNALQKLSTKAVALAERRESFTLQQVPIETEGFDKEKIALIDTVVSVTFEIGERRIEKSFAGVAVRESTGTAQARPEIATVTLYGERSVLDGLRAADIQLVLDVGQDGAITPRLVLPPGMENRVELRSIVPTGFTIIR